MTMMGRILITRKLPGNCINELSKKYEIDLWQGKEQIPYYELKNRIKDKDALICLLSDKIDREIIDNAPNLKIIANYAVGYDNIDVEYATKKGIYVTNTPGVLTDATAELAWALLFSVARRVREGDIFLREGKFKGWQPELFLGKEVTNSSIGVIGAGRIGQSFMKKGIGFNIKWCYYSRKRKPEVEKEFNAEYITPLEMFEKCDFVSLHVPLTKETYHLIGKEHFDRAKGRVILINTARGPVVDEKEMIKALYDGRLKGAGLDVYENEPYVPEELIRLNNVVLLPHIGSATYKTRTKMAEMVCKNVDSALSGKIPPNLVNRELGII